MQEKELGDIKTKMEEVNNGMDDLKQVMAKAKDKSDKLMNNNGNSKEKDDAKTTEEDDGNESSEE